MLLCVRIELAAGEVVGSSLQVGCLFLRPAAGLVVDRAVGLVHHLLQDAAGFRDLILRRGVGVGRLLLSGHAAASSLTKWS